MRRALTAGLAAAFLAAASTGPAGAAEPRIYHTIKDTTAYAEVSQLDDTGCIQTSLWVGSSVAMYTGKPSGLAKQKRTTVDLVVRDLCAPPPEGEVGAAAVGGQVIYEASGQSAVGPVVDTRLTRAHVSADFVGEGGVPFSIDASWTGTGTLTRDHVNTHVNLAEGVVSTTANEVRRDAVAEVTATIGSFEMSATTDTAVLSTLRFRCIEVPRPGVEEFYPCFGFPG